MSSSNSIVAVYVLAMALLPLTHHDIACHLKSSTHCTTCLIGSAADLASGETSLGSSILDDAGQAGIEGKRTAGLAVASDTFGASASSFALDFLS